MINVKKSDAEPDCLQQERLKANGKYDCPGVREKIKTDGNYKCYLCEDKNPTSPRIEHVIPHRRIDKQLEFDWQNLAYCCEHCNAIKGDHDKFHPVINCFDWSRSITRLIRFDHKPGLLFMPTIANVSDKMEEAIEKTVLLLNNIYNPPRPNAKKDGAENLRGKLNEEILNFRRRLDKYFAATKPSITYGESLKVKIKASLKDESPFTAFKIWIIRSNKKFEKEFGGFIEQP